MHISCLHAYAIVVFWPSFFLIPLSCSSFPFIYLNNLKYIYIYTIYKIWTDTIISGPNETSDGLLSHFGVTRTGLAPCHLTKNGPPHMICRFPWLMLFFWKEFALWVELQQQKKTTTETHDIKNSYEENPLESLPVLASSVSVSSSTRPPSQSTVGASAFPGNPPKNPTYYIT